MYYNFIHKTTDQKRQVMSIYTYVYVQKYLHKLPVKIIQTDLICQIFGGLQKGAKKSLSSQIHTSYFWC